ncbi:MAG: hypothetical protein K8R25_08950 [Methanosarcinales archaeon]|nr:hypothetical protein [Methanosarcinales archaeon]
MMEDNVPNTLSTKETTTKIVKVGGTIILMLLLLASSFGFYTSMQSAICDIIEYRYQDLIRSIFNLFVIAVVLLVLKKFFYEK